MSRNFNFTSNEWLKLISMIIMVCGIIMCSTWPGIIILIVGIILGFAAIIIDSIEESKMKTINKNKKE